MSMFLSEDDLCLNVWHFFSPLRVDGERLVCQRCGRARPVAIEAGGDSSEVSQKKYTIWLDYNTEGWQPIDCATLAECFDLMRSYGHSGDYRITRDVDVEIRERDITSA